MQFGNSDEVRIGEWVLAVGNPLNLTSTVTAGIVSAKGRNIRLLESDASKDIFPVESFLQTDAAVNPGNSGGALVNLRGELIGINTAIASRTGSYAGYSFAIPSSIVAKVTRDLKEFGRVQRAYLGIQVASNPNRVEVASTLPDGGAAAAGVRAGDQIVALNGIPVTNFPSLQEQLSKHRPGDRVNLTLARQRQSLQLDVTLTDRAGTTTLSERPSKKPDPQPTAQSKFRSSADEFATSWGVSLEQGAPRPSRQTQPSRWRHGHAHGIWILAATRTEARIHCASGGWTAHHERARRVRCGASRQGITTRRHVDRGDVCQWQARICRSCRP